MATVAVNKVAIHQPRKVLLVNGLKRLGSELITESTTDSHYSRRRVTDHVVRRQPEIHAVQIRVGLTCLVKRFAPAIASSDLTNRARGRSLPAIAAWIWVAASNAAQVLGVASNRSGLRLATRSPTKAATRLT